nr:MAG TPA: hypothetical protein [Caudoviricetes sp.]
MNSRRRQSPLHYTTRIYKHDFVVNTITEKY